MERTSNSTQIEQTAAEWLARRDLGACSEADNAAFEAWLSQRTEHRVAFLRLQAAWREAGRLQALAAGWQGQGVPPRGQWSDTKDAPEQAVDSFSPPDLRELRFSARKPAPSGAWRAWTAAAVTSLAVGAAAWGGWQLSGQEHASYASAIGEVQDIVLADGSTATLSSNSRLEVQLSRGERHIELLQGEAFFDVAHDKQRPFVVQADARQVTAVGTRFAVRRDDATLRVVVTEGKVRLGSVANDGEPAQPAALLPAGSMATASSDGVLVRSLALSDAQRLLEWRDGFLSFEDTTLADAAAEFNRYNSRPLEIGDDRVAQLRVGGNFRWSNTESFVHLLEQGFPVRAERHPDRIVLHSQ